MRPAVLLHAVPSIEPLIHQRYNVGLRQHFAINLRGDVRLECPHRLTFWIIVRISGIVLLASFTIPRGVALIMSPNAMIEVASQTADRRLVADIRRAEPAARQAAYVARGLDENDALSQAVGLNGSHDAGRCAAIDHDVGRFYCSNGSKIEPAGKQHEHRQDHTLRSLHPSSIANPGIQSKRTSQVEKHCRGRLKHSVFAPRRTTDNGDTDKSQQTAVRSTKRTGAQPLHSGKSPPKTPAAPIT